MVAKIRDEILLSDTSADVSGIKQVMTMTTQSIDRRAARTRAKLQQAHLSLILQKGYEATTIKDICSAANVGRSTFYAHYSGKDDLKRSAFEHLRKLLADRRAQGARLFRFSLPMFEHARDFIDVYRALAGNRGGDIALESIRRILSDLLRGELAAKAGEDPLAREFSVQYFIGAYMALLTGWLDGGAKLPPRQMDAMFRRLASGAVSG